jgi:hypothetical protein
MAKKVVKKDKKEKTFKESHVLVVLEKMEDSIKLLAEGQAGFREEMNRKFEKMEGRLNEFERETRDNFGIVFEYLKRIDEEVQDIKARLGELDEGKIGKKEYNFVMKRMDDVEEQVRKLTDLVKTRTALAK